MDSKNVPQDSNSIESGKKIFFLYPTAPIMNQIITELIQHEYEAYVAKNHTRLARVIKKFPDSIIYVNVDENMPINEWETWINDILTVTPSIKFGFFSSSIDGEVRKKLNNNISCGFFHLKLDMNQYITTILEVLELMNAKGKRKYLRACTEKEINAVINMPFGGDFLNGTIKDISVVGTSCVFKHDPELSKNSLLKDIQLRLQSILLKVEAVIFGSREVLGEKLYVMLYTQRTDPDVRVKIRKYIQMNLQHKMDLEIN